jgi:hypothetical protein
MTINNQGNRHTTAKGHKNFPSPPRLRGYPHPSLSRKRARDRRVRLLWPLKRSWHDGKKIPLSKTSPALLTINPDRFLQRPIGRRKENARNAGGRILVATHGSPYKILAELNATYFIYPPDENI